MVNKKILCVIGTRPEVIKMAPVILRLRDEEGVQVRVIATAQHREMLDQMLNLFQITPDQDFNIMKLNQSLAELTANLIIPFDEIFNMEKPDLILAQGDTTTAFAASLAGFYNQVPFGHVEAGLRTNKPYNPFPEEMNRVLIGRLASLNFAPTNLARNNLISEGVPLNSIHVTGNTVIDAMQHILKDDVSLDKRIDPNKRLILVTAHRRENFGENLAKICTALLKIVECNDDVQIFYPVHLNPNVQETVYSLIGKHPRIILSEPIAYAAFLKVMKEAYLILSDSGGVQEEAPVFGIPLLILRDNTERVEGCEVGVSTLVGTEVDSITRAAQYLLDDPSAYAKMVSSVSPYGDGKASEYISNITLEFLGLKKPSPLLCFSH